MSKLFRLVFIRRTVSALPSIQASLLSFSQLFAWALIAVEPRTKAAIIDLLNVFIIFLLLIKDTFINANFRPTLFNIKNQ
ncbi:hypothetical protein PALI_a1675 [Pseudoalteromonas aliena SW19]|uniref:Uncharacterized protein n=1 Tax=Pseudoalteromonas aliena SW19 TaxID=1314866 RepID=A0ABR9DVQ7_9GAMM|nr:hypothetical protein [Pseudoalteromonas aliena SW19]